MATDNADVQLAKLRKYLDATHPGWQSSDVWPGLTPVARYNVQAPDGRQVPVTNFSGYDPSHGSWQMWRNLLLGKPADEGMQVPGAAVPGTAANPYDQTQAPWNLATTRPGQKPASVGYGFLAPTMEWDSNTGAPFVPGKGDPNNYWNPDNWSASSHMTIGGPNDAPFTAKQIMNAPQMMPATTSGNALQPPVAPRTNALQAG